METVLGVSMVPRTARMVLVEGGNADGVTVYEDNIERTGTGDREIRSGPDQVISAILGTREAAVGSGYQLRSTGVTLTDPAEAAALRNALDDRKIGNVMLVSAFGAAAALAQEFGCLTGYRWTGLLFVEPHTATLAVVNTADGSLGDVRRRLLRSPDLVAELVTMVSGAQALHTRPDGLFVVGSGVDIAPIKPALEAATALVVSTPEEPETALARGAALASVHGPLLTFSTVAQAYARDPGTGAIAPHRVAPADDFCVAGDAGRGEEPLAYSAVADDQLNAYPAVMRREYVAAGAYLDVGGADQRKPERRPLWVVAVAVAVIFVVGVVALVIALAMSTRASVGTPSHSGPHRVAPTNPAPAPNAPRPGAPTLSAVPPVIPQGPTHGLPWPPAQPPGGDRHGNEGGGHGGRGGHAEGGGHGEGGRHGGAGHSGGGGTPGY